VFFEHVYFVPIYSAAVGRRVSWEINSLKSFLIFLEFCDLLWKFKGDFISFIGKYSVVIKYFGLWILISPIKRNT